MDNDPNPLRARVIKTHIIPYLSASIISHSIFSPKYGGKFLILNLSFLLPLHTQWFYAGGVPSDPGGNTYGIVFHVWGFTRQFSLFQVIAFKRLCSSTVKLLLHNGVLAEILQLKVAFMTDFAFSIPNIYFRHLTTSPDLR